MERRSSTWLQKRNLDNVGCAATKTPPHHHHLHRHHHRPKAGASPTQNDCGVLPGEWYFIKASADQLNGVPWGYVCGWPIHTGDMYGGGHYVESASAKITPQGRAILETSTKFGDGRTLPFLPCKRFYNPFAADGTRLFAWRLHSNLRRKRLEQEGWKWRDGEKRLDDFWDEMKLVKGITE